MRRQHFEREAKAIGALNHPNIVAVYDADVEHAPPYLVTELLEGQTLRDKLVTRLASRQAIDYAGTEDEHSVFLKTIIPSRKAAKPYLGEESDDET